MSPRGMAAQPPGWDGEPRGEPGIHGIARPRRWDAVGGADAPDLTGDRLAFVVLPDATVLAEAPAAALAPLRAALGGLPPPYRAEAVLRGERRWAVAGSRIRVITAPELIGDAAEVVVSRAQRTAQVDGRPRLEGIPALEQVGREHGVEFVVRAWRLRDDLVGGGGERALTPTLARPRYLVHPGERAAEIPGRASRHVPGTESESELT